MPDRPESSFSEHTYPRIELVWPGKGDLVGAAQTESGEWLVSSAGNDRQLCPLVNVDRYPPESDSEHPSLVVAGNRLDALATLQTGLARGIRLAYLDVPRLRVDDKAAVFKGDPIFTYSTWLSVLRAHLRALEPLLRQDGFVIIHSSDLEEPYARLVAEEVFGRDNRVATIVWQRSYAPRNMKGMKEFTATHDCLVVYATSKADLDAVGLRAAPTGFDNPDDDPRKAWKAEHKGAHSQRTNSDFDTYTPPYRWRLTSGELPPGLWRLNQLTGVIWGVPEQTGDFEIEVEVSDAKGSTARGRLVITCVQPGQASPEPPPQIPWLFVQQKAKGKLRVASKRLPVGIVGEEYSAICLAEGGEPHALEPIRPGSGRYWEFAKDTLVRAYQTDSVYLGRDGRSIPHPKQYLSEVGDSVVTNQVTWWPGRTDKGKPAAGYTQDATKHLKRLVELGLIGKAVTTAKPEHLLARVIDVFTDPNDVVLEAFSVSADMSCVALKRGRRFILLSGGESSRDRDLFEQCGLRRIRAVIDGKDRDLDEGTPGEIKVNDAVYIPFEGGGSFLSCNVGEWLFRRRTSEDFARMNSFFSGDDLTAALLTSQGFLTQLRKGVNSARTFLGTMAAVVIPPTEYFTMQAAATIASNVDSQTEQLRVYYFKAADDFDESVLPQSVVCRRVPSDIRL